MGTLMFTNYSDIYIAAAGLSARRHRLGQWRYCWNRRYNLYTF